MSDTPKPPLKARLEALLNEYGPVFVVIYFALFVLVMAGFTIAIGMGIKVQSAAGAGGTLFAAWVATKVTTPFRIAAAAALTPLIGRRWARKS